MQAIYRLYQLYTAFWQTKHSIVDDTTTHKGYKTVIYLSNKGNKQHECVYDDANVLFHGYIDRFILNS